MTDQKTPEELKDEDLAKAKGGSLNYEEIKVTYKDTPITRDDTFASDGGLGTTRRTKTST